MSVQEISFKQLKEIFDEADNDPFLSPKKPIWKQVPLFPDSEIQTRDTSKIKSDGKL